MTKGKAILIDPFMKQVTHVPYEYGGSYTQITEYISTPEASKPPFTCVGINEHGDSIFVDDEGLYRDTQASRLQYSLVSTVVEIQSVWS